MIRGIKFVSVPVRNQDRALEFYVDSLGCSVVTDQPFDKKQRWIELRFPKSETRLVLFTPDGQEDRIGSMMNVSLWSDDVEATYAALVDRGVVFIQAPEKAEWGTAAIFQDVDGNSFVLSSK